MKTKHGLFDAILRNGMAGFVVLLLAAIFSFTLLGCPTDGDDNTSTNTTNNGDNTGDNNGGNNTASTLDKTRFCNTSSDEFWSVGNLKIHIEDSVITFLDTSSRSYAYAYDIAQWVDVGDRSYATVNVRNGRKTSGYYDPSSQIAGKTSFGFWVTTSGSLFDIVEVDGVSVGNRSDDWYANFSK